jgi:arylsulfatase A-like enzyme
MAGLPLQPKDHTDGRSWAGALRGSHPPAARTLFWHNPAPRPVQTGDWFSSALREGDLKLLAFPETSRVELYDLRTDLGEATNLAERRPDDTRRLLEKLSAWQKDTGAAAPGARRRGRVAPTSPVAGHPSPGAGLREGRD